MQGLETTAEIHRPLACDIVRDLDVRDFAAIEIRCDYVISIYISNIVINVDSENSR